MKILFNACTGRVRHPFISIVMILDKSGRNVGVWYSAIRAATVDVDENGRIVNLSPTRTVTIGDQGR
jgi:hypothetical protein